MREISIGMFLQIQSDMYVYIYIYIYIYIYQSSQHDAFSSQVRDYFPQALNAAFNFV